jgi:hypothetical protein
MLLRQTDLLPTLRAGLTKEPEAHWVYYSQPDKKLYTRVNVNALSPVIAANHYLYEPAAAIADRITPVTDLSPQEVWDFLWPREGASQAPTVTTADLWAATVASAHFPVLPEPPVLWQALQEGARENRWVLYLRGPNLAIGAQEMAEWPGMPRFDKSTELWTYQAAIDQKLYPRKKNGKKAPDLTAATLKAKCWPAGAEELPTEDMERFARGIWTDLSRPQLETTLRDGLREAVWAAWQKPPDEVFYTSADSPRPAVQVSAAWSLVEPDSALARQLDQLRPGKGPQAVEAVGTPREALTAVWEQLGAFRDARVASLTFGAADRDTFDNTLVATWADRPPSAQAHVSIRASGRREAGGKEETVRLEFEGRFEEVRGILAQIGRAHV